MRKIYLLTTLVLALVITSCSDDDSTTVETIPFDGTGNAMTYDLSAVSDPDISGTATFVEKNDGSTDLIIIMDATGSGEHPAHIHMGNAADGGDIAIDLMPVDGATGKSTTNITATNSGIPVTYDDLIVFDGYINVHASASDLGTLLAQGDIGENDLTGDSKSYMLNTKAVEGISGTATFSKRVNGEALLEVMLDGTPDGGMHPGHIHFNSAAESGGVAITLTTLDGTTGMSKTNISALNDGTAITYAELLNFDGYINFHLSADDLATLVAQGDIGENELTGVSKVYDLKTKDVDGISGTATFAKRKSGAALVTVMLDGTPDGGMHPGHIHNNSAAETGGIAKTLTTLDGTTGMSVTHIEALNDGTEIGYDQLLNFDGYINFHLSADDLATLVAQGDIGENELTGDTKEYDLVTKDVPGVMGTATFAKRKSGAALVTVMLDGTTAGGMHPGHIHNNSAVQGGGIAKTLTSVDGATGMSVTHIEELNDGTEIGYDDLLDFDGYINFHLSADDLATLVAQGDIGQNELTGMSKTYDLATKDVAGIMGTATFAERKSGETLVTLDLEGTPMGGMHPAHIHAGSVAEAPGDILITLATVDGTSGMSQTHVTAYNGTDGTANAGDAISYDEMVAIDGYINVHLSATELSTLVAQGNVGSNVE